MKSMLSRGGLGLAIAFGSTVLLPGIARGELSVTRNGHEPLVGIRDSPVPYDDTDTRATVEAGIRSTRKVRGPECGKNPYKMGVEHICHPRHSTYVRTGEVLKSVLIRDDIMPDEKEFERYRLTIVLEAARAGLEHVTALMLWEERRTHSINWVQLEQHYSSSIDDPRTMSVYVDLGRTRGISTKRLREAIDYVDAYRRGVYTLSKFSHESPCKGIASANGSQSEVARAEIRQ
jgi:hypothetical protein